MKNVGSIVNTPDGPGVIRGYKSENRGQKIEYKVELFNNGHTRKYDQKDIK